MVLDHLDVHSHPEELAIETLIFAKAREALGGFGAVMQLTQPLFDVLAGCQNNNDVGVAAAQLEVVTFGTKNLDRLGA